jgi:hypothetical protein
VLDLYVCGQWAASFGGAARFFFFLPTMLLDMCLHTTVRYRSRHTAMLLDVGSRIAGQVGARGAGLGARGLVEV